MNFPNCNTLPATGIFSRIRIVAFVGLLCASFSLLPAAVNVYTTRTLFEDQLSPDYFQNFDAYAASPVSAPSATFSGNGLSFTVSTNFGSGNGGGLSANLGLVRTALSSDSLVITPVAPTTGIGGNFFFTDASSAFQSATINITISFSDNSTNTFRIAIPAVTAYRGFVVDDGRLITQLRFFPGSATRFATVDNVSVGSFAAIPEPSTFTAMLAGFALLTAVNSRRPRR
jgi:hypothetical protein